MKDVEKLKHIKLLYVSKKPGNQAKQHLNEKLAK